MVIRHSLTEEAKYAGTNLAILHVNFGETSMQRVQNVPMSLTAVYHHPDFGSLI
jgi:hypothetical protein